MYKDPICLYCCRNLQLGYIDLYLIHFPASVKPMDLKVTFEKEDVLPFDIKSIWEAMEECQRLGLAKSIGVSNFSCKKLSKLLSTSKIPPAVNQVSQFASEQIRVKTQLSSSRLAPFILDFAPSHLAWN